MRKLQNLSLCFTFTLNAGDNYERLKKIMPNSIHQTLKKSDHAYILLDDKARGVKMTVYVNNYTVLCIFIFHDLKMNGN